MDTAKNQDLLNKKAQQYKIINGYCLKQDLLNTKTEQDRTMDATKKQTILEKSKERIYLQELSLKSHTRKTSMSGNCEQFKC